LENFSQISGRVDKVDAGQNFEVIVDYAHTPDSLEALYKAFHDKKKICVLGNTGGGRDTWKRPVMAGIADKYCDKIILTNEDPYDEEPMKILEEMKEGVKIHQVKIILDRREAIKTAISLAKNTDVILVSGKGTDPYIMEENGKKRAWSDKKVATEELEKFLGK
jgi:UDP-N-acetylmuramoyl-L-alanyl-D-glutamate--2,6-diaminopimelate ligase